MPSIKAATQVLNTALLLVVLAACTGATPASAPEQAGRAPAASGAPVPASTPAEGMSPAPATIPTPVRIKPAPPMSGPLPPEIAAQAGTIPALDQSCRTSADCVVKDVGSCCGALPACVNRNSRTDPAAVQAECARKGISSVCGFNEITGCTCANGKCVSEQEPMGGWINGAAPPQTDR